MFPYRHATAHQKVIKLKLDLRYALVNERPLVKYELQRLVIDMFLIFYSFVTI